MASVKDQSFSIRPAKLTPGKSGRPVLAEVSAFGTSVGPKEQQAGLIQEIDPLELFSQERLIQCDEAFVAEHDGRIIGAVTLAFEGVYKPKMPTLDALSSRSRCTCSWAMDGITFRVDAPTFRESKSSGDPELLDRIALPKADRQLLWK